MTTNSKIEWTRHTFNPWIGCTKVSDGCKFCYAEELMDKRYGKAKWGPDGTRKRTAKANWNLPRIWDREAKLLGERHRVFCASLADVFEDHAALVEPRAELFELIDATPHLDWLLLTKRPENIRRFWQGGRRENVWRGTSVENQETADLRIPELLATSDLGPISFLSVEPLLGPVDLEAAYLPCPNAADGLAMDPETGAYECCAKCDYTGVGSEMGIDWVIVGGESGHHARPCHVEWIRKIVRQCASAEVPVFVKQLGSNPVSAESRWGLRNSKGGDPSEWPEDLRVRQFPEVTRVPMPAGSKT